MQNLVRIAITIDGKRLPGNVFDRFSITQQIGRHHSFELQMNLQSVSDRLKDVYDLYLGKELVLGLDYEDDSKIESSNPKERFKGIITSIALSNYNGSSGLIISGKSPTYFMEDGSNTRSFTDKTLQEIIDEVIKPYKFPKALAVSPKQFTGSIPYTVQYEESNFNFISRLADRNGEWFYNDGLECFFGKPEGASDPIKLDFESSGLVDFSISIEASPSLFGYTTYDYIKDKKGDQMPSVNVGDSLLMKIDNAAEKVFPEITHTLHNVNMDEHESRYLIRREEISVDEQLVLHGSSHNINLKLGSVIQIKDNGPGQDFGKFIITRLSQSITQGGNYMNHFEACSEILSSPPLSQMYISPYCGTQLALVTDLNDDKKLGRVKVQFFWQKDKEKSPWIRVASPYTGKDKGFYIIPEKGDQVLVAFENNNPEKPYVLSGMYHGNAKPEWFDAQNKYKGFKSKGNNEWKFDDDAKSITINAPSDIFENAKKITLTGTDEINLISGDASIVLKKDGTITIKGSKKVEIESPEVSADGTNKIILGTDTSEATLNGQKVTVKGVMKAEVKAMQVELSGDVDATVSGGVKTEIKGTIVKIN